MTRTGIDCNVFAVMAAARPLVEIDRIRAVLTTSGRAWTRPRSAVLQILVGASAPLRVEEIHDRIRQTAAGRRVNLSSVYRTVNLLRTLRVARRVSLGEGAHRYELADGYRAHHHHFVCERCGRIEDVRRCPIEGADLGLTIRSHHLELFGLCRRCASGEGRSRVRI